MPEHQKTSEPQLLILGETLATVQLDQEALSRTLSRLSISACIIFPHAQDIESTKSRQNLQLKALILHDGTERENIKAIQGLQLFLKDHEQLSVDVSSANPRPTIPGIPTEPLEAALDQRLIGIDEYESALALLTAQVKAMHQQKESLVRG